MRCTQIHARCSEERAELSKERVERLVKIYPANQITFHRPPIRHGGEEFEKGVCTSTERLGHLLDINIVVQFIHLVCLFYARERKKINGRRLGKKERKKERGGQDKEENEKDGKKVRKQAIRGIKCSEKEREKERDTRKVYGTMETTRVLVVALAHGRWW